MERIIPTVTHKIKEYRARAVSVGYRVLYWAESETGRSVAYIGIVILATWSAFLLGKLSVLNGHGVQLDTSHRLPYIVDPQAKDAPHPQGTIVASRKGSKYHYVWCPGARTISEKNKRYFKDEVAARAAGLQPASNCPGLK